MNRRRRSTFSRIVDTIRAVVLLGIGVFLLVAALVGPAEPEPLDLHWRPTTEQEIQQRQGDRLMDDLNRAYQEGQR